MKVKNFSASSIEESIYKLEECEKEMTPNLAIIFSDPSMQNEQLAAHLKSKDIEYIGCSSSGEIIDGTMMLNTVSISLFQLNKDFFRVYKQQATDRSSYEVGTELIEESLNHFSNPGFISLFTMNVNGESFISGMKDTLKNDPLIYGGMAADENNLNPYVFTDENKYHNAFHTIIFDLDKIELDGFAIAGWDSIGTEHKITSSKDNVIYEINEEPALDFFKKFFGFYADPLAEEGASSVNSQYPLQLSRGENTVLRAPLSANETENSLILAGPVEEGETFKFSVAPGFSVINDTIDSFKKYKSEKATKPDAMILFSCKARHWAFGPMIEEEVKALNELWEIPYHGFFSFGEIGKNKDSETGFFNETCCLVTIKER